MNKEKLKEVVCNEIDKNQQKIIDIGMEIFNNPELGYKEFKTAKIVENNFDELELTYENKLAITGSKAILKGKESKVTLAIMGELDAVLCPEHPNADINTGAAHSCGHNAQVAAMLGAAMGLKLSGANNHLSGDIAFMAVPAEEPVEVEFRQRLREKGEIEFLGGKQEFIKIGAMDDVDMTIMFHSSTGEEKKVVTGGTSNGFVTKLVKYIGKEAHAGGAPHNGVNALNAAIMGLQGIHAQRETFKDDDHIRIHPIITKGGDLVNIVPADVRIETYVRGSKMDSVLEASKKVNRALKAGAMAIGAEVDIIEIPGFLPRFNDPKLTDLFHENAIEVVGEDFVGTGKHGTGSSDIGDVMHLMPAIHPYVAGMKGSGHTKDYQVIDPYLAFIVPAKLLAMTAIDVLAEDAKVGLNIKETEPKLTKDEYFKLWKDFTSN
jgi:amidohydrolase